MTVTDINGNFSIPVLSGIQWNIGADSYPGYFGPRIPANNYQDNMIITPTASGPNTVNMIANKETAWIEGTVRDEYNTKAVEGALFYAMRINSSDPAVSNLQNGHYTNATGNVSVGLSAGS